MMGTQFDFFRKGGTNMHKPSLSTAKWVAFAITTLFIFATLAGFATGASARVAGGDLQAPADTALEVSGSASLPFMFVGVVESLSPLVVSGVELSPRNAVAIEGELTEGAIVQVAGVIQPVTGVIQPVAGTVQPKETWLPRYIWAIEPDFEGCFTTTSLVRQIAGKRVYLNNWPTISRFKIAFDGELEVGNVIFTTACIDGNGVLTIMHTVVIQKPGSDEASEVTLPTPTLPPPPPPNPTPTPFPTPTPVPYPYPPLILGDTNMHKPSLSTAKWAAFTMTTLFVFATLAAFVTGASAQVAGSGLQASGLASTVLEASGSPSQPFMFVGVMQSLSPPVVSGVQLATNSATMVEGDLAVGALVQVAGIIQSDGTWLATYIRVLEPGFQGCFTTASVVTRIEDDLIYLNNWPPVNRAEIEVAGELKVGSIILTTACVDETGALTVTYMVVIQQADDEDDEVTDEQVTICHYPPGNPANAHTITVGASAVDAHVRNHGDTIGPCP
jgi:hypothetical protein